MLLAGMALNPLWLEQAFQCLPYSPLVLCSSLHCLAWMRYVHHPGVRTAAAVVVSGSVLPWLHFFGVNVLIAEQLVWCLLMWNHRLSVRHFAFVNLSILMLTLPTVPLAAFYVTHDSPYPLLQIADYWSYFWPASSYCFWRVTIPALDTEWPFFLPFHIGCGAWLLKNGVQRNHVSVSGKSDFCTRDQKLVVFGLVLAGFLAAQLHSLISHSAIWPRYMLAGSWLHLPIIVILLESVDYRRLAWTVTAACAALTCSPWGVLGTQFNVGTDYDQVASRLARSGRSGDAFLVQSFDLWHDENHFDRIWLDRYTDGVLRPVTAGHHSRQALMANGLPVTQLPKDVDRVWIYSHLFKEDWLRRQSIDGWNLVEINATDGVFPVALIERQETDTFSR